MLPPVGGSTDGTAYTLAPCGQLPSCVLEHGKGSYTTEPDGSALRRDVAELTPALLIAGSTLGPGLVGRTAGLALWSMARRAGLMWREPCAPRAGLMARAPSALLCSGGAPRLRVSGGGKARSLRAASFPTSSSAEIRRARSIPDCSSALRSRTCEARSSSTARALVSPPPRFSWRRAVQRAHVARGGRTGLVGGGWVGGGRELL